MTIEELLEVAAPWQALGAPALAVGVRLAPDGRTRKRPLTKHGHLDAVLGRDELAAQLEAGRHRLADGEELAVGVVPGGAGLFVLDFDAGADKEGLDVLGQLLAQHLELDTCSYRSISGGVNVVLAKPDPAAEVGNHSPWTGRGVDVRGDAGWIVAPGVVVSWGAWDWRSGGGPAAAIVAPAEIVEQLRPPGHLDSVPASAAEVADWLDHGGDRVSDIEQRWLAGAIRRFEESTDRNPTMFVILDELVAKWGLLDGELDRHRVYDLLEQAWVERMLADNVPHRVEEIAGMLARKVGYYAAQREASTEEEEVDDDPFYDRDVAVRERALRIDEAARALNHSRRIASLGQTQEPLIGGDQVAGYLEAGGALCYWGTGDVVLQASGQSLMLAGREGTGKSTLALQVVRAALGGRNMIGEVWKVLGHRVEPLAPDAYAVYLALDRPPQLASLALSMLEGCEGADRFVFWRYALASHVAAGRDKFLEWFAGMLGGHRPGLVVVDSLKDVLLKPSSDEDALRWHQIRTALLEFGVQLIELHHLRKEAGEGNDQVFGSALLTAGVGSILRIQGVAGDSDYLLMHTKIPVSQQEPLRIRHHYGDDSGWWTEVVGTPVQDMTVAMLARGEDGFTIADIVNDLLLGGAKDKKDTLERSVRREIDRLIAARQVVEIGAEESGRKRGRRASRYRWVDEVDTIPDTPGNSDKPDAEATRNTRLSGIAAELENGDLPGETGVIHNLRTGTTSSTDAVTSSSSPGENNSDTVSDNVDPISDAFRRAEEGEQ